MADFQFKTEAEIIEEIRKDLESSETPVTDWSSGSANRTFWEIAAKLAAENYYMQGQIYNILFADGDVLKGDLLDRFAKQRAVFRKQGVKAAGSLILSRSTPSPFSITSPAGTTFSTLDRLVTVQTKADVTINTGATSVTVAAEAVEVGVSGKLAEGTELIQTGVAVNGLETIRVGPPGMEGGVDAESDEDLLKRYLEAVQNPSTGDGPDDYKKWAKEVPDVVEAYVLDKPRGLGTVDVIILSSTGIPSTQLIAQVQEYINKKMQPGLDLKVRGPESASVDIDLTYETTSLSSLDENIIAAIQKYIHSVPLGDIVRVALLANAVLAVPEVTDARPTKPATNIVLTQYQIAVPGTITVKKGG